MRRGYFGGENVGQFGGLTFANNKFQLADPAYDEFSAITEGAAQKWDANKAAYENTVDFINAQNVLDPDKGIKGAASDAFVNGIKPFVESGRYEDASIALDKSVRDFKNNKAFGLATSNYAAYSEWSQKQRDEMGWSDADKSNYVQGISESYKGVKVHKDGTVSGSFVGRDMGKFVDIQSKIAPLLKGWTSEKKDQLMKDIAKGDWKTHVVTGKKTTEYNDQVAVMEYVKNLIDTDPEIGNFLETKRHIANYTNPSVLANNVAKNIANNVVGSQEFNNVYASLKKNATTDTSKKELADFQNKYGLRDQEGNLRKDDKGDIMMSSSLYSTYRHLEANGLTSIGADGKPLDPRKAIGEMSTYITALSQSGYSNQQVNDLRQRAADGYMLTDTEKVILRGAQYKDALVNIDSTLYRQQQAYEAYLPLSGVKESFSVYDSYNDEGKAYWGKLGADESRYKILPTLVTQRQIMSSDTYLKLKDGGIKTYEKAVDGYKSNFTNSFVSMRGTVDVVNNAINKYNEMNKDVPGFKKVDAVVVPTYANEQLAGMGNISASQKEALNKINPEFYNRYYNDFSNLMSNKALYDNSNALLRGADEYAKSLSTEGGSKDEIAQNIIKKYGLEGKVDYIPNSGTFVTKGNYEIGDKRPIDLMNELNQKHDDFDKKRQNYIDAHIQTGLSTDEVDISGIRESSAGANNELLKGTFKSMDNVLLRKLTLGDPNSLNVKAISGKDVTTNVEGGAIDYGFAFGFGKDHKINDLQVTGFYKGADNKTVYVCRYTTGMGGFGNDNNSADGIIEISDNNNEFDETFNRLLVQQDGGKTLAQTIDTETYNAISSILSTQVKSDVINFNNMTRDIRESGVGVVKFKNRDGLEVPQGTLRLNLGSSPDDNEENGTLNKNKANSSLTYEYSIKDANGKPVIESQNFRTMAEFANFVNGQEAIINGR